MTKGYGREAGTCSAKGVRSALRRIATTYTILWTAPTSTVGFNGYLFFSLPYAGSNEAVRTA